MLYILEENTADYLAVFSRHSSQHGVGVKVYLQVGNLQLFVNSGSTHAD